MFKKTRTFVLAATLATLGGLTIGCGEADSGGAGKMEGPAGGAMSGAMGKMEGPSGGAMGKMEGPSGGAMNKMEPSKK